MKRITIKELSVKEIDKAIKEVEEYRKELKLKVQKLAEALVKEGTEIAKMKVVQLGAFDSGNLAQSINGYYSPTHNMGVIKTDVYYAVYVEFGTGLKANQSKHPLSGEYGYSYDVNGHGEKGWYFYNQETGVSGWTQGMPSRPFMYETGLELEQKMLQIAKTIFK